MILRSLFTILKAPKAHRFDSDVQNLSPVVRSATGQGGLLVKLFHFEMLTLLAVILLSVLISSSSAFAQMQCQDVFGSSGTFHSGSAVELPQAKIWKAWVTGHPGDAIFLENNYSQKMRNEKIEVLEWIDRDNALVRFESGFDGVWRREEMRENGEDVNLAAIAVAKKLRLFIAPLEIARDLDGMAGSVQLRTKALSETELIAHEHNFALFDFLVQNSERKSGTYIFSQERTLLALRLDGAFKGKSNSSSAEFMKIANKHIDLNKKLVAEREKIQEKIGAAKAGKKAWFGLRKYDLSKLEAELEAVKIKEVKAREESMRSLRAILFFKLQNKLLIETSKEEWQKILSPYLKQDSIDAFVERTNEFYNLLMILENTFGLNIYAKDGASIFLPAAEAFAQ